MRNKFRLVGGDFLSEKKEHVVGHEHFWRWSSEIFFLLKFWFWIIRGGKSDDQDINLVWPYAHISPHPRNLVALRTAFFSSSL